MNTLFCITVLILISTVYPEQWDCYGDKAGHCTDAASRYKRWSVSPIDLSPAVNGDMVCGNYSFPKECVHNLAHCQNHKEDFVNRHWAASEAVFDYLCGRGKEDFMNNMACWNSAPVGTGVSNCLKEEQKGAAASTDEEKCRVQNKAVECNIEEVKKSCNKEAVSVMKHFQILRRRPIAAGIKNCTLVKDNSDWDEDGTFDSASLLTSSIFTLLLVATATLLSLA